MRLLFSISPPPYRYDHKNPMEIANDESEQFPGYKLVPVSTPGNRRFPSLEGAKYAYAPKSLPTTVRFYLPWLQCVLVGCSAMSQSVCFATPPPAPPPKGKIFASPALCPRYGAQGLIMGNGAESRKTFHFIAPGYGAQVFSPTQAVLHPMLIDTTNREKTDNATDPGHGRHGIVPKASNVPPSAM